MDDQIQHYRSVNGQYYFTFVLKDGGGYINIYAIHHPGYNGQDSSAHKTHLFADGRVCIAAGREPRSIPAALELAKTWAEYFLEYRQTGVEQH